VHENPYKYTGPLDPVKDRPVCIPRTEEAGRVIDGLKKGEYWVVIGPAQIGKTTFLHQVESGNTHTYNIYLDLNNSPGDIETFFKWLIQRLINEIPQNFISSSRKKKFDPQSNTPISENDFFYFLKIFKPAFRIKKKRVVILFDNIENTTIMDKFLNIWRSVYTRKQEEKELDRYSIIVAGSVKLAEKTVGFGLPFNIAKTLYLKDFSYEQSRQLIAEPFKQAGISIDNKAKEKLIGGLNGHPRMLQQSCHFLFQRASEKKEPLAEKDVDDALAYALKENPVLTTLAQDIKTRKPLSHLVQQLLKGEHVEYSSFEALSYASAGAIVEGPGSSCAIRSRLFEEFLKNTLEKKKPVTFPGDVPIKEPSEHEYLDKKKKSPMPCAVKQIQVRNYHGIIETGIHLPIDARWIFLTGENAFGKTALLRAITIGLYGPTDQRTILLDPENECDSKIGIEIYYKEDSLINNVGCPGVKPFSFGYFAAYGSSRLEIQGDRTANEITGRSARTYSIFNSDGVSLNIERELVFWFLKKDPRYETVKTILLALLPNGADITVDKENNEILYTEKEKGDSGGDFFEPIPFPKLAAGNKSIIALVGDLVIRFYKEYENDLQKNIDPVDFEGIVIIDELNLHLHPKWLRRLPKLLSDLFPKIQFIAATHSEISLLGAPRNSVILKVTRTRQEGILVQRLSIDIKNFLSHHILTSPIFDLEEECIQEGNENLSDVRTEDSYREIREMDETTQKLKDFENSDRDYPRHIFSKD
jgi:energy-coupling factor transporter ATP-binding protein EcfA2